MPKPTETYDCLMVGAGIIGLSLAYELARSGLRVCVLDRGDPGREASWAGAGILPPGAASADAEPLERFLAHSRRLHGEWAARLREETGVDTGFQQCGGLYVAREEHELESLRAEADRWSRLGTRAPWLSSAAVGELEPALAGRTTGAYLLPDEAQLRNPRHLKALLAACRRHHVEILDHTAAESIPIERDRVACVHTTRGRFVAGAYCLAAGCWSSHLAAQLEFAVEIKPIRGQIVLLKTETPVVGHVVNQGLRYLVPRGDGRLIVGSTMEDVGFDRSTTAGGIGELLQFAIDLAPELAASSVERIWSGLRPATADGLPLIGRIPHLENAWIAAGHFRNGLTLSTGTAQELGLLIRGESPTFDLSPFLPGARDEQPPVVEARPRPHATRGVQSRRS